MGQPSRLLTSGPLTHKVASVPKIKATETEKVTIRLQYGDMARIKRFYPKFPANAIIRQLVKGHLDGLEARLGAPKGIPEPEGL